MHDATTTPRRRTNRIWLPALLVLLGFAVRSYRLEGQPLSGDEAYSAIIWVQYSLDYLLSTIALATTEPHPPLALITLHGWAQVAGDSIFALRLFAVLPSLVTLAATYRIGRMLGGEKAALLALAFSILSPFQLWYAQFTRNYSLWMAGSALTALFLLWGWQKPRRITRWIPYVVSAVLTAYVFYLEAFVFIAHNLYALTRIRGRRGLLPVWALTQVAIVAALAPWYIQPELWANSRNYEPNGYQANVLWGIQSLLFGNTLPPWLQHPLAYEAAHSLGIASAVGLALVIAAVVVVWKTAPRRAFWFALLYALTPLAILTALAAISGRRYFHPRYIASSSAALILVVALGAAGVDRLRGGGAWPRRLAVAGTLAGVALSLVGMWHYHFDGTFAKGPDWPGIMRLLNAQATTHDVVIHNYPDPAFGYYFEHDYTGPADEIVMPNAPNPPYEQLAADLDALTADYDYIWFMPIENPAWDRDHNVARWLAEERQAVSDQWIGFMRLYQYADWQPAEGQIRHKLDAQFGEVAELAGYRATPTAEVWQPGSTVHLEVFWRPLAQTDAALKVFVHLRGPEQADGSILWAQDDRFPQDGRVSTQRWEPGGLLRDVHPLVFPPDLPPGQYTLAVGLYDPDTGQRVGLDGPPGAGGPDYAALVTFVLP